MRPTAAARFGPPPGVARLSRTARRPSVECPSVADPEALAARAVDRRGVDDRRRLPASRPDRLGRASGATVPGAIRRAGRRPLPGGHPGRPTAGGRRDRFPGRARRRHAGQARTAWLAARPPYLQTEVFRFSGGPIDALETLINAWPIDESYIDAVVDAPDAGIVNAVAGVPELSRQRLASLNEQGGETNVSVGYHALEFLLWGQDLRSDGAGRRAAHRLPAHRPPGRPPRRVSPADGRPAGAAPGTGGRGLGRAIARRTTGRGFWRCPEAEALGTIFRGLGVLTGPELAGERLTVAYETKDQEDEHSCFSDNTHNDLVYNVIGIQNVSPGPLPPRGPGWRGSGCPRRRGHRRSGAGRGARRAIGASLAACGPSPPRSTRRSAAPTRRPDGCGQARDPRPARAGGQPGPGGGRAQGLPQPLGHGRQVCPAAGGDRRALIGRSIACARSPAGGPGVALRVGDHRAPAGPGTPIRCPPTTSGKSTGPGFFVGNSFFNKNWVAAPSSVAIATGWARSSTRDPARPATCGMGGGARPSPAASSLP